MLRFIRLMILEVDYRTWRSYAYRAASLSFLSISSLLVIATLGTTWRHCIPSLVMWKVISEFSRATHWSVSKCFYHYHLFFICPDLYTKLNKAYLDGLKEKDGLVDSMKALFTSREEAEHRIRFLKDKAARDLASFNTDFKDTMRILDHDRRLRAFMTTKEFDLAAFFHETIQTRYFGYTSPLFHLDIFGGFTGLIWGLDKVYRLYLFLHT